MSFLILLYLVIMILVFISETESGNDFFPSAFNSLIWPLMIIFAGVIWVVNKRRGY